MSYQNNLMVMTIMIDTLTACMLGGGGGQCIKTKVLNSLSSVIAISASTVENDPTTTTLFS